MSDIIQYDIWIAELSRSNGTEPGKKRPVIVLQSDVLNKMKHRSTIICVVSSQMRNNVSLLRIPLEPNQLNGLKKPSYILCDQIRSIDNMHLQERIGKLTGGNITVLQKTLKTVFAIY